MTDNEAAIIRHAQESSRLLRLACDIACSEGMDADDALEAACDRVNGSEGLFVDAWKALANAFLHLHPGIRFSTLKEALNLLKLPGQHLAVLNRAAEAEEDMML